MNRLLQKTIRPTKLQPQLFSVINMLAESHDYRVIVNKDNKPLCIMVSYSLIKDIDLEKRLQFDEKELIKQMKEYYADMPAEDAELVDAAIDDGIYD